MSDSASNTSSEPGTLYNPSQKGRKDSSSDEENVSLRLSMPKERAERLQAVAQQIGLSPSTVAKRAIEMVCDEVVTIQDDSRPPSLLVEQYQARLDLLHSVHEAPEMPNSNTDSVDEVAEVEVPSSDAEE